MVVLVVVGSIMNLKDVVLEEGSHVTTCNIALCNTMPTLHLMTVLIFTCKITCRCSHVKITLLFVYNFDLLYPVWLCFRQMLLPIRHPKPLAHIHPIHAYLLMGTVMRNTLKYSRTNNLFLLCVISSRGRD
jgi:hypothetical protein